MNLFQKVKLIVYFKWHPRNSKPLDLIVTVNDSFGFK